MRGLSPNLISALKTGVLAGLRERVIADKDLDLHIREGYLNIYYKGNSLLKLTELPSSRYRITIHPKFVGDMVLPDIRDAATAQLFLDAIPQLKEAIIAHGKLSLETEYEQLLIRANNLEPRTTSEYFIVDRQYARGAARFDLIGVCWPHNGRKRDQTIAPCFFEIKFALNTDIREVHDQLKRYHDLIAEDTGGFAQETEQLFKQKLALGLFKQPQQRLDAMKTLTVSKKIEKFQFIVVLVDFNPFSTLFRDAEASLATLDFAPQIKIFHTGFALWRQNLKSPAGTKLEARGETEVERL
jgi:hypothetical protein